MKRSKHLRTRRSKRGGILDLEKWMQLPIWNYHRNYDSQGKIAGPVRHLGCWLAGRSREKIRPIKVFISTRNSGPGIFTAKPFQGSIVTSTAVLYQVPGTGEGGNGMLGLPFCGKATHSTCSTELIWNDARLVSY